MSKDVQLDSPTKGEFSIEVKIKDHVLRVTYDMDEATPSVYVARIRSVKSGEVFLRRIATPSMEVIEQAITRQHHGTNMGRATDVIGKLLDGIAGIPHPNEVADALERAGESATRTKMVAVAGLMVMRGLSLDEAVKTAIKEADAIRSGQRREHSDRRTEGDNNTTRRTGGDRRDSGATRKILMLTALEYELPAEGFEETAAEIANKIGEQERFGLKDFAHDGLFKTAPIRVIPVGLTNDISIIEDIHEMVVRKRLEIDGI